MKITAEIFDFEKFDYASQPDGVGWEYLNTSGSWQPASGARAAPITSVRASLYRRLKPPPVFMLLNEGEALQAEDQRLLVDYPRKWARPLVDDGDEYGQVLPGEVWRRPTDDLAHANQRLQREIESLEREVVELQLKIKNFDKSGEE